MRSGAWVLYPRSTVADDIVTETPTAPEARWVLQNLGDTRRVGRVVDESPGAIRIEFLGGDKVSWDALPKSARFVDPTSLAFRNAAEPDDVRDQLANDPAALGLALLREARTPLDAVELRQRLAGLGLVPAPVRPGATTRAPDPWPDLWRRMRPALLANEHVRVDGKRLAWSDTAIAKASAGSRPRVARVAREAPPAAPAPDASGPLALLERLATAGVDAEERQSLRLQARDALVGRVDPYLGVAASALGLSPSSSVNWSTTPPPSPAAPAVASEVLRLARRQEAWRYLLAAATSTEPVVADRAQVLLDGVAPGAIGSAAAEEIDAWSTQLREGMAPTRIGSRLTLLVGVLPQTPSVALLAALARLLVALAPRSAEAATRQAVGAALEIMSRGDQAVTERALAAAQLADPDAVALLSALAGQPAGSGSARAQLLEAVAGARADLVAEATGAWQDIDPGDIAALSGLDRVGGLLTDPDRPLHAQVTLPLLARLVDKADLDGLLAARHWPDRLVELVPADRYAVALRAAAERESAVLLAVALGTAPPAEA